MSVLASLLLPAVLALRPDAGLRIHNPHDVALDATLGCGESVRALRIEPNAFADVPDAAACTVLESLLPLTALETHGAGMQRAVGSGAECGDPVVYAPLFACASGTGTAGVPVTEGATYSWSVEGAAITDGAGTPRVALAFSNAGNVKLTCVVTTKECSRIASAVIAVREPLAITTFTLPQTVSTNEPVTIVWTYGGSPASQMLTGDAFEEPIVLASDARSYTFTPTIAGARNVELRASYFAAMNGDAPKTRRRAAGRSTASASDCATVSTARAIEVKGCSTQLPRIHAPASVDAGTTFEARAILEQGEQAEWSVENATVVDTNATTGRATIRAGENGEVKMTVRIVRGACTRSTTAAASIVPAAKQCPVSPNATLALLSQNCSGARVKATFTGTPPFRGTWSDGASFETWQSSLEHTFSETGTYGLSGFRDLSCIGVVSGAPRVETLRPKVKLETIDGACTTGKLVAKFTGTPPFSFKWTGPYPVNEWTETSSREVVRELQPGQEGVWRIEGVRDALCTDQTSDSNAVEIRYAPTVEVLPGPMCQFYDSDPAKLFVRANGQAPYSVTWSDGVVTTSNVPNFTRSVPKPNAPLVTYKMVRAISSGCIARLGNDTATVSYRPVPRIDIDSIEPLLCPGEIGTATLDKLPAPEATIVWTVPGGEILSGQGTPTITYRGTSVTDSLIRAEAVYPDGACMTFDHVMTRFHGISAPQNFKVTPTTIAPGQSAAVTFTIDQNVSSLGMGISPKSRESELTFPLCKPNTQCVAYFKDATGPGTVTFELQYWGECMTGGYKSVFTTLTIQE